MKKLPFTEPISIVTSESHTVLLQAVGEFAIPYYPRIAKKAVRLAKQMELKSDDSLLIEAEKMLQSISSKLTELLPLGLYFGPKPDDPKNYGVWERETEVIRTYRKRKRNVGKQPIVNKKEVRRSKKYLDHDEFLNQMAQGPYIDPDIDFEQEDDDEDFLYNGNPGWDDLDDEEGGDSVNDWGEIDFDLD